MTLYNLIDVKILDEHAAFTSILKMEALCSSKTLVSIYPLLCCNPKNDNSLFHTNGLP
jgi:hypothetical protein